MTKESQIRVPDEKALLKLVDRTGSIWPRRRASARKDLLERGVDVVEPLRELFARDQRRRVSRTLSYRRWTIGTLVVSGLTLLGAILTGMSHSEAAWGFILFFVIELLVLLLLLALSGSVREATRQQALIANVLIWFDDVRAVGPLAQALHIAQSGVPTRKNAIVALTDLLPRLQADQADLLDAHERECLHRELKSWTEKPASATALMTVVKDGMANNPLQFRVDAFTIAVLDGLATIGDTQALPYVRRLCAVSEDRISADIKQAAQRCLAILEPLAEQDRHRQQLLRATVSDAETPQEILLRAAQGAPAMDPQQLLRATEEDTEGVSN